MSQSMKLVVSFRFRIAALRKRDRSRNFCSTFGEKKDPYSKRV